MKTKYLEYWNNKPLKYLLDVNRHESCIPCGNKPNVTNHKDRVALENDLLGNNRKLSRDPKQKYQKNEKIANVLPYLNPLLCERNLQNNKFLDNNGNNYMNELKGKKFKSWVESVKKNKLV